MSVRFYTLCLWLYSAYATIRLSLQKYKQFKKKEIHIAMYVYKLKSVAKRSLAFASAVSLLATVGSSALPALVHADALNPLTQRTLLLSSSSPGYHYLDAAGNTTYAAPGSGPNGKQSSETFSFKISTNGTATGFGAKNQGIQGFTFDYCTTAAGNCTGPGNNTVGTPPRADTTSTSDLNVKYPTPGEVASIPASQATGSSLVPRDNSGGNFAVIIGGVLSTGWTLTTASAEQPSAVTGQQNHITLVNTSTTIQYPSGTQFQIVFYSTDTNYITNPGAGAFFVKINDYSSSTDVDPLTSTHVIDGGVTVANVMTDSIQIQTKVLETMSFSVGTINPDAVDPTVVATGGHAGGTHGTCDAIGVNAPINLGNPGAEYSLEVNTAWDAHSYWRLSSNSSNGASVYYSGYTLSDTEGDQIAAIGTGAAISHPGNAQYGLAFDTQDTPETASGGTPAPANTLSPLTSQAAYANGTGTINGTYTAQFAFDRASASTPALLATESSSVVGCTTGRMRYIGNIAAATPAGIYSSKVNYLAAPQY